MNMMMRAMPSTLRGLRRFSWPGERRILAVLLAWRAPDSGELHGTSAGGLSTACRSAAPTFPDLPSCCLLAQGLALLTPHHQSLEAAHAAITRILCQTFVMGCVGREVPCAASV